MKRDIEIRLSYKDAKALLGVIERIASEDVTKAQATAISEFAYELRCSVMEEKTR